MPSVAEAEVTEIRRGATAQSDDARPFIGQVAGVAGLFLCAGHGPWGISTGPASAALVVAAMLDGVAVRLELAANRPLLTAR